MAGALWSRVEGLIFGTAVGRAGSEAVTPVLEPVRQRAWKRNRVRVLGLGQIGELAAKGIVAAPDLSDEAARQGYDDSRIAAVTALSQTFPGLSELDEMSNRKVLEPALVDKALSRHGIPAEYHEAVKALFQDLLSPGELAAAIHRGLVQDPINPSTGEHLLKGEQPEPPFKVDPYPVYPIDAAKEAAGSGYDINRLGVLVGLQGLPMGTHEAAQAFFRGIITHGDYIRAFNESNSRNEWAQAVLDYTRQIPTARDFLENALRGHNSLEWAQEQAARHGMSKDDAFILWQNQGRPLNLHQITQGLAWGASYHPGPDDNRDPWMQSVLLGPVRPEYYELQHSLKYTLPSALYFRTLQQNGVLAADDAEVWYKRLGWPPELAHQVAQAYAKQRSAAGKEATATDLLTLFVGGKLDAVQIIAALEDLGYPADEAQRKVDVVDARRVSGAITSAIGDLHTAFKKGDIDGDHATNGLLALGVGSDAAVKMVAAWQAYIDAFPPPTTTVA